MHIIHDADVLLLLATLLAGKRKPAELPDIVAAIDLIQSNVPAAPKLCEAFAHLSAAGLLATAGNGYALTPDAQNMVGSLPGKASVAERLALVKAQLSAYRPQGQHPGISVAEADINAAIAAHRAAAASGARNLLVPKPKPEADKARPGQRQRKPMPARKRRK